MSYELEAAIFARCSILNVHSYLFILVTTRKFKKNILEFIIKCKKNKKDVFTTDLADWHGLFIHEYSLICTNLFMPTDGH